MENKDEKMVAIVGLGYVGLPLALLVEQKGYNVIGIDVDAEKVSLINKKIAPFFDQKINEDFKKSSLKATTDFSKIAKVSVVVVCVPTPVYKNNLPNLEPVENACKSIAPYLTNNQLVVLESTVNPNVCDSLVVPVLEKISKLKCGKDFYLAHCPERINPGDSKWNVKNINRVVGGFDDVSLKKAVAFYRSIIDAEVKPMTSLKEAEAVKIVENTFRDVNIAFVNELSMSFSKLGIDVVNVINGAATKPFAFMAHYPSCGVGGHCIPVDPYYMIDYAKQNGFEHKFLSLARKINSGMPAFTVNLVEEGLKENGKKIKGARVLVLGLAYKPEVSDCRESPSLKIIKRLETKKATVVCFDPFVLDQSTVKTLDEAFKNIDAVVIATGHKNFRELKPDFFLSKGVAVLVDGSNCLPKNDFIKTGIIYKGIGR